MGVDERLQEGLSRVPPADPGGAYERVVEKKIRRRVMRKAQTVALAVVVVAGSSAGFVALSRAFAPDGNSLAAGTASNGRIVFSGHGAPDAWDVYSVNADGSDLRNLTNTPGVEDVYPNVSPDGTQIAYCRLVVTSTNQVDGGIWVMDIDGGDQTQLTDGGNDECYPTWSPDGSEIAFDGPDGLYVMSADGSNMRRITEGDDDYPAWSPTGGWIAFHGHRGSRPDHGSVADIYLVRPDGTGLRQVTDAAGLDIMPNWSPDGTRIAFMTDRFVDDPETYPPNVAVMDVDGTNVVQLTTGAEGYGEREPFWSPDGALIGFQRSGDRQAGLFVVAPDGSNERQVLEASDAEGCCLHPSWQPVYAIGDAPSDTPTKEATPSVTPSVGDDIGLGQAVCDVTSARGSFGSPGVEGTAFVATMTRDGRCPHLHKADQVLAIDLDGDDLVDVSFDDLECEEWCNAWTAPDIDGDDTDEVLVQNIQFSVAGLQLYDLLGEPLQIVAVTVAPPGDPGSFEPGTRPQLWYGGDAFGADGLDCVGTGPARVLVSSMANQDPPESGPWYVHETTFRLVGGTLEVVQARDYRVDDPDLVDPNDTGICGARNPYWGG